MRAGCLALALLMIGLLAAAPQRSGVFAVLQKGQCIGLKDLGDRFEITVVKDAELGFRVMEVGLDYLVVQDIAGVTETRIPIYSVKSVKVVGR